MNTEPEKQDELQRVLALKRHEAPPPRFFKSFSGQVLDRLHTPEPPQPRTIWQRLGLGLDGDNKTVQVCGVGLLVCGLLGIGLVASRNVEPAKPVSNVADDPTIAAPPPPGGVVAPDPRSVGSPNRETLPRVGDPVVVTESTTFRQIVEAPALTNRPAGK